MQATLLPRSLAAFVHAEVVEPERWDDPTHPSVIYYPSLRTWRLSKDFIYYHLGRELFIPAPFDFDLASIPRILWAWLASHELGVLAPLLHDWFYRSGGLPDYGRVLPFKVYSREDADKLFLLNMTEDGVPRFKRELAYRAVRWFGGKAWQEPSIKEI